MKLWLDATSLAAFVYLLICSQQFLFVPVFDQYTFDKVGIKLIEHTNVFVPFVGRSRESASLVACNSIVSQRCGHKH